MLSFTKLWANHPNVKGEAALLDKKVYENQCAINLHAALERAGVNFKTFHGQLSWQKDKPKYALRAQELADWLTSPFSGMHKIEKYSGQEAFDKLSGKRGIIFFQNYWGPGNQGDHIDLWNGSRLTDWKTWALIHARIGSLSLYSVLPLSDYKQSQSIWFWPVFEPVG